jgi:hypothetical protein
MSPTYSQHTNSACYSPILLGFTTQHNCRSSHVPGAKFELNTMHQLLQLRVWLRATYSE